jgi:Family of unknown function (DUF6599)
LKRELENGLRGLRFMQCVKLPSMALVAGFTLFCGVLARAQVAGSPTGVVALAPPTSTAEILPDRLSEIRAAIGIQVFDADHLREIVGERSSVYAEFRVKNAFTRTYGRYSISVFETESPFAAYGLFTFERGTQAAELPGSEIGAEAVWDSGHLAFWKGRYFVTVAAAQVGRSERAAPQSAAALSRAVAERIALTQAGSMRPPLIESLPNHDLIPGSSKYILGTEALSAWLAAARDLFVFRGDAEAVVGTYVGAGPASADQNGSPDTVAKSGPQTAKGGVRGKPDPPTARLVIVEYHTPQFAFDAMERLNGYLEAGSNEARSGVIFRREGNYIVGATQFNDRAFAQNLVDSVKYPYTVKWLRDPLLPTNDPFQGQKAAQMLLSTFVVLGVILVTVLVVGSAFGTAVFFKRRRRQREIFSDAGGMLRLGINQIEAKLLALPPKRD